MIMAIQKGDSPEGEYNKFLGFAGEGHRGKLLYVTSSHRTAVIEALTSSHDPADKIKEGKKYLVREISPCEYPEAVMEMI